MFIGVGLIVLDGEQQVHFSPLNKFDATKMQITESERVSFNSEIDQVNALTSFVNEEVVRLQADRPEVAAQIRNEVKDSVSSETFSAMVKVAGQLAKK